MERAHDAAGHRSLEPERASERENLVTDGDRARIGETQRLEQRLRRVDAQDCDVRRRIDSDDLGVELGSIPEAHGNRGGAGDDVLVGHDVPGLVVDEAGALRARLPAEARAFGRRDLDDGLRRAVVDLPDGQRAVRDRLGSSDGHLPYDGRRAVVDDRDRGRAEPDAEGERGDEAGDDEGCASSLGHGSVGQQCG